MGRSRVRSTSSNRFIHAARTDPATGRFRDAHELPLPKTLQSPYDGHVHTTVSDGERSPLQTAHEVHQNGLTIVVTDHYNPYGAFASMDALDGLTRFEHPYSSAEIIAGIELSVNVERGRGLSRLNKLHLLGVGLDRNDPGIRDIARKRRKDIRHGLRVRSELMNAGFAFADNRKEFQRQLELKRNPYSTLATDIMASAKNLSLAHEFLGLDPSLRVLTRAKKAHQKKRLRHAIRSGLIKRYGSIQLDKPTLQEGVSLVHNAGGIAVVPHILTGNRWIEKANKSDLTQLFKKLKAAGIDGIEAFHPEHPLDMADKIAQSTLDAGLLVTGGSDAHKRSHRLGDFSKRKNNH